jgi:hypothetical protein
LYRVLKDAIDKSQEKAKDVAVSEMMEATGNLTK